MTTVDEKDYCTSAGIALDASMPGSTSVPKYKSFYRFHYELHMDVYRHILECRFTNFAPYVVRIEISKKTYI